MLAMYLACGACYALAFYPVTVSELEFYSRWERVLFAARIIAAWPTYLLEELLMAWEARGGGDGPPEGWEG